MNLKRTATIGVVGGALAAWLAAAATSGIHDAAVVPAVSHPAIEARGAELAREIARLHEWMPPVAAPHSSGRNLFQFSAPRPRPAAERPHTLAVLSEISAAPLPPPLKLSGIAEDPGPDGPIRTAIISGPGQLFLVKEGQMVTSRYRVAHISADVVELTDLTTNVPLRLAIKP